MKKEMEDVERQEKGKKEFLIKIENFQSSSLLIFLIPNLSQKKFPDKFKKLGGDDSNVMDMALGVLISLLKSVAFFRDCFVAAGVSFFAAFQVCLSDQELGLFIIKVLSLGAEGSEKIKIFLQKITSDLLRLGSRCKGRYVPLALLTKRFGAKTMLDMSPDLLFEIRVVSMSGNEDNTVRRAEELFNFMRWLSCFLFFSCYPSAPYKRKIMAMELIQIMINSCLYPYSIGITSPKSTFLLVGSIIDSWDRLRESANTRVRRVWLYESAQPIELPIRDKRLYPSNSIMMYGCSLLSGMHLNSEKMAEHHQGVEIPRVKLGTQGLEVSKLGFGCMGLSENYNEPVPDEVGISIIKHAFATGITFFDTSNIYGPQTNEILVGKALKQLPRKKVQLATKFGVVKMDPAAGIVINGTPEYVRASIEASLKRLDVDYIDLYYQHTVDTKTPIEDTMGELKKLVEEGKIKYIGLSEAIPETIRRAHVVHPSRDIENEIIPLELGIGIVSYSPLGRGFFGGRIIAKSVPTNTFFCTCFQPLQDISPQVSMRKLGEEQEILVQKHGRTPSQFAFACVLHQGDDVAPIPGATKIINLKSNIDALRLKLTEEDLKEITAVVPLNEIAGSRTPDRLSHLTWKFANTPTKEKKNTS
ncbi:hypothetical protein CXB51_028994 [Gossypium anomalum]|uniref:NADP-dependent oxidoreductase domain-containing protein n=1 Tax=Gossypium anomalum TaxID=47600 RepID=A0A8J5YLB2_9ROSI|nr:hypothetical protein CXB51_028994 [Gossypium anomalum]